LSYTSTVPVLFLIGDLDQQVVPLLHSSVPQSVLWEIQSFVSAADAVHVPAPEAPHLAVIVCHQVGDELCADLLALLAHAKVNWPSTFFVLLSQRPLRRLEELFERFGVMPTVSLGDPAALVQTISSELAQHSRGSVQGVSLPSFLQMMEWDQKSVSVRVTSGERWGRLHLHQGRLVNAYAHATKQVGEAAALDILAWEQPTVELERSYHNQIDCIGRPLTSLLMEAMQHQDEAFHAAAQLSSTDLLMDDPEEDLVFRRPKHSTAQLSKPVPAPVAGSPPPVPVTPVPVLPAPVPAATSPTAALPPTALPLPSPSVPLPALHAGQRETIMANVKETLNSASQSIDGIMAAALVDYNSGMALGTIGSGLNLELAAAGNSDVVRAKIKTMEMLGIQGQIEDMLITLQTQYHIIYIVPDQPLFLYLVLAKDKANLAMSRYQLKALAKDISIN
jgi:predicted regulator of Ras-like GTPase activity (Roadblock/LC7/MglB family)